MKKTNLSRHPLFFPLCYGLTLLGLALHSCSMRPNIAAIKKQLDPYPAPSLSSLSPTTLFTGGGATLTLSGSNFITGARVDVDGSPCQVYGRSSATTLTCVLPAHAAGSGTVTLTNPDGQSVSLGNSLSFAVDGFSQLDLVAGNPDKVPGYAAGSGKNANFFSPTGVTSDGVYIYVADQGNDLVRKIDPSSGAVTIIAGTVGALAENATPPVNPQGSSPTYPTGVLDGPTGLALNGATLYVSCYSDIFSIDLGTGTVTLIAGTPTTFGSLDSVANPLTATFNSPEQMAFLNNQLYIADTENHNFRKINLSTGQVSTFAGFFDPAGGVSNTAGYSNGVGTAALFAYPVGIFYQGGLLYVSDNNEVIRSIDPTSALVSLFVGDPTTYGYLDGPGSTAEFYSTEFIAGDGVNLYVADTSNSLIRKINVGTAVVSTAAGQYEVYNAQTGPISSASFDSPTGIFYSSTLGLLITTKTSVMRLH